MKSRSPTPLPCPCGKALTYAACCGRFHAGAATPDAESLMRSRYSAYVMQDADYLLATWHSSTRPPALALDEAPVPRWIGLTIVSVSSQDDSATVEFIARYRLGGKAQRLHEISRFRQEDGRWRYLDGQIEEQPEPARAP